MLKKGTFTWNRVQININDGGYSTNALESSINFSGKNNSWELITGYNKVGYTYK